ncbi:MAG: UDP-glucose 4-epimerase GalE [Asticcacaulis sp.]
MSRGAVLVAGGAGYIGAQTCKVLAQSGYTPVVLDNLSTGHAEAVKWGPFIQADLTDHNRITEAIGLYDIKAAIHFAAFSLVGESARDPAKYYQNNVAAATQFTASLIAGGVKALVFSSTAAVYGNPQTRLIAEGHPKNPINPYGASKLAFEQALHWLSAAHGLKYTVLRYFNAAGADPDGEIGESHACETHLIPLMCQAALGKGKPLTIFGTDYDTPDGTPVRDYIHVVDLATAHVAAIERLMAGGDNDIFNVGTGSGYSVLEVIKKAEEVMGISVPHSFGPRREGDPEILVADVNRIRQTLNWVPRHSDLETLIRTASHWQNVRPY